MCTLNDSEVHDTCVNYQPYHFPPPTPLPPPPPLKFIVYTLFWDWVMPGIHDSHHYNHHLGLRISFGIFQAK